MKLSRRTLIGSTAAAVISPLATAARSTIAGASGLERVADSAWRDLAGRIRGSVFRPGDSGYAALASPENTRYSGIFPEGIVVPADENDIATTVQWVRQHPIDLITRCGGHNYAGYSATRGLLLHLKSLKGGSVDTEAKTATVLAGMQNGDVLAALSGTGMTVPFGRCPSVGVSGYTLGGGIGFHTRRLGVGCDRLLGTRVVTATGEILDVNAATNSDLFWACRGGAGGNFGVHTSFTFQLSPAQGVTVYSLKWGAAKAEQLLLAFQDLITDPALISDLSMQYGIRSFGTKPSESAANVSVYAQGWYYGTQQSLAPLLAHLTNVDTPTFSDVAELDWVSAQKYFNASGGGNPYLATSVVAESAMSDVDVAALADYVRTWPGSGADSGVSVSMFAMGGADTTPAADAMAFPHRNSKFIMSATTYWAPSDSAFVVEAGTGWVNRVRSDMSLRLGRGAYVDFPDPNLFGWWDAYYRRNYEDLVRIKLKYDPSFMFRYPQGIRPIPLLAA